VFSSQIFRKLFFLGVSIWGFNSPEWFISDVGTIFAGGMVIVFVFLSTKHYHINGTFLE
jgi:long-subunit acyl-CoA synthetase (AMP-forming)